MFRMRWLVLLFTLTVVAGGQTFRGGITGVVVDSQGAVVANAPVQLRIPATDTIQNGKANGDGEFSFPELQPGIYEITVSLPGFQTRKITDINVEVSKVVPIKVELAIGSESTVVDVVANGVQVDTTNSSLVSVVDAKSVQDMPMNGRDFTKMIRFNAGVTGSGMSNGNTRVNYQVDGTDNVDAWLGAVASNQGGIASVPGGLIPIEAIDQFSIQSQGEADMGRNAGANQNMVMKSGTNQIHGDLFYLHSK